VKRGGVVGFVLGFSVAALSDWVWDCGLVCSFVILVIGVVLLAGGGPVLALLRGRKTHGPHG
jgi:hypothetical protein